MKYLLFIPLMFMQACAGWQTAVDDVEKMVDNDAITIKVDKDSFQRETDVHVKVDVLNKEQTPEPVAPAPAPMPAKQLQ